MTLRTILLGFVLTALSAFTLSAQLCPATTGPDQELCINNTVAGVPLGAPPTAGVTYTWNVLSGSPLSSLSNSNSSQPIATPTDTTVYQLITSTNFGCADTDTVVVNVNPSFNIDPNPIRVDTCLGPDITIGVDVPAGNNDLVYLWTTNLGTIANNTVQSPTLSFTSGGNGTATVAVTDTSTGCTETVFTQLQITPLNLIPTPPVEIRNPGQWVQLGVIATNSEALPVDYTWTPDMFINCTVCDSPEVRPTETTTYTVEGVDQDGCMGETQAVVAVVPLLIPNVFSPNGDGINDELQLNYFGTSDYEIEIYDRWGRRIFQTTDPNTFWDGRTDAGQDAPEGVYYLTVRIVGDIAIPGESKNKAFPVHLVR